MELHGISIFALIVSVIATLLIFIVGIAVGASLVMYGHKRGVRLVDRIKHDLTPFGEDSEETKIQTYTDGTIEEL